MNKTVLITGASGGLGYAFAKLYAQKNYTLILTARNHQRLNDIAAELLAQHHVTVITIPKDLSQTNAPQEIHQEIQKTNHQVDILINNAGFGNYGEFADVEWSRQSNLLQVNIVALTHLTHLISSDMKKRNSGQILNIASTAGFLPGPLMATYYASKAYVVSFSEAIHEELKKYGITVTCLCPGVVNTGFGKNAGAQSTRLFNTFHLEPDTVAEMGYTGLQQRKNVVIVNWVNKFLITASKFVPITLTLKAVRYIQESKN